MPRTRQFYFASNAALPINEALGFASDTIVIDNPTGQYLHIIDADRFIAPGASRVQLTYKTEIARIEWAAPQGVTQPNAIVGQTAQLIYASTEPDADVLRENLPGMTGRIGPPGPSGPPGESGNFSGAAITLLFAMDGSGSPIPIGRQIEIQIDFPCVLQTWTVLSDLASNARFDIWRAPYVSAPPTVVNSICGGNPTKPQTVASNKGTGNVTGWTAVSLSAGDVLIANVDANDNATRLTLSLKVARY